MESTLMYNEYIDTPIGVIECKASNTGITETSFCDTEKSTSKGNQITARCKTQLFEYFAGKRKIFDLPLDPQGTAFQKSVWLCLSKIPYGELLSYGDIANMINNPKASQAVGGANSKNPISIIVPCHRVIGANGTLTGYAGGLDRKLWLLQHEGVAVKDSLQQDKIDIDKKRYRDEECEDKE